MSQKPTYKELENRINELEKAEKKRSRSEKKLLTILSEAESLASLGGWEWDILSDVWTMSKNWQTILGCSSSQLTTAELLPIAHPDDMSRIQESFDRVVKYGERYNIEHRIVRQDTREVRWIEAHGTVKLDSAGKAVKVYGAAQDITDRKQTEEKLRETHLHLNQTISAGNVGLWDWDLKTNKVFYSKEWKKQIGYDDHEIGDDFEEWQSRVHPDDLDKTIHYVETMIEQNAKNYQVEFRFQHRNGTYRWILAQASVFTDESGRPIRTLGSHVDITEHKKAEDALKKSSVIIDSTSDAVITTDIKGNITFWNKGAEALYGYSKDEILGKSISIIYKEEDIYILESMIAELLQGKDIPNIEVTCVDKNQKDAHILLSLTTEKDKNGNIVELIGITKDITDRKKTEELLRKERDRAKNYLNIAGTMILALDINGNISLINKKGCEILDGDENEIIGKNWFENFLPEKMRKDASRVFNKLINGHLEPVSRVQGFSILTLNNKEKLMSWNNTLIKDSGGKIIGTLSSGEDVSEQRKAEDKIRESEASLREQSRNLSEANAALKVLLKQREDDRKDLQENVLSNVKQLISPHLERLKASGLNSNQMPVVDLIESNLENIVSPFIGKLSSKYLGLTPMEIRVAELVKQGKTAKEIAEFLCLSINTVSVHRYNLRAKLGLNNKKTNLRSFLMSLDT